MASKFNMSGVLTSQVDYLCLACECRLHNEEDAKVHIAKSIHIKNFQSSTYFEQNSEDSVRKFKKWYFCEFCNLLLATAGRVRLHIVEPKHLEIKGTHILKRKGEVVIAFGKLIIDDKTWNGLIDDTCFICNVEFEDEIVHKNENVHVIKLITSKIEYDSDKNIFRKIDDCSFQCLTCNKVYALSTMISHFNQIEHKNNYQKCQDLSQNIVTKTIDISKKDTTGEILDIDSKLFKAAMNDNKESENTQKGAKDISKKHESNVLTTDKNTHKENGEKPYEIKDKKICEILGAKNYVTVDEHGKTWCILCDWILGPKDIDRHINDLHHRSLLKLHKKHLERKTNMKIPGIQTNELNSGMNNDNVTSEFRTAACRVYKTALDFNSQSTEDHILSQQIKEEKKDACLSVPVKSGVSPIDKNETNNTTNPIVLKNDKPDDIKGMEKDKDKSINSPSIRGTEEKIQKIVKENNLEYIQSKNKVYCNKCDNYIPFSLKCLQEHIAGIGHRNKIIDADKNLQIEVNKSSVSISDKKTNLLKMTFNEFVKIITSLEGNFMDVIINDKLCINFFSFFLVTMCEKQLRCLICEGSFHENQLKSHTRTSKHGNRLKNCFVVLEDDSEFVREIQTDQFHCGFCNVLQSPWNVMVDHLTSTTHRESKTCAQWRMQQYMPQIIQNRKQQPTKNTSFNQFFSDPRRLSCSSDSENSD